jgi:hypothetical protein
MMVEQQYITTTNMSLLKKTPPSIGVDMTSPSVESKEKDQLVSAITELERTMYLHLMQADEDQRPNMLASPPAYQDAIGTPPVPLRTSQRVPIGLLSPTPTKVSKEHG